MVGRAGMATRSGAGCMNAMDNTRVSSGPPSHELACAGGQGCQGHPSTTGDTPAPSKGSAHPAIPVTAKKGKGKTKKDRKTSADKAAEVAAFKAQPVKLTKTERKLIESKTTVAPPERPRAPESSMGLGTSAVVVTMQRIRRVDDTPNARELSPNMFSDGEDDDEDDNEDSKALGTPEKHMNVNYPLHNTSPSLPSPVMNADYPLYDEDDNMKTPEKPTSDDDIEMQSPPHPEGSSRAIGGILRGNAKGNTLKFANHDVNRQSSNIIGYKKASVFLYSTHQDPTIAHKNGIDGMDCPMKVSINYNTHLAPILRQIEEKYSQIAYDTIFVLDDDGFWEIKGRFETACDDPDDEVLYTLIKGVPVVTILKSTFTTTPYPAFHPSQAASIFSASVPSTSRSGSTTPSIISSTSSGSKSGNKEVLSSKELMIIDILKIDRDLTHENPAGTLRDYFKRWTTGVNALSKIGTTVWDVSSLTDNQNAPTKHDIIRIFTGKSNWYYLWSNRFRPIINTYPQMRLWLENDPASQSTMEIWGINEDISFFKFATLHAWINNGGKPVFQASSSKGKVQAKSTSPTKGGNGSGDGAKT